MAAAAMRSTRRIPWNPRGDVAFAGPPARSRTMNAPTPLAPYFLAAEATRTEPADLSMPANALAIAVLVVV